MKPMMQRRLLRTEKTWKGRCRNNRVMALLALGEGYHNNHHARPKQVRAGLHWYEPDVSSWAIAGLEKLGLAWDVRWE